MENSTHETMKNEIMRLSKNLPSNTKPHKKVPGLVNPNELSPFHRFKSTFFEEDFKTVITGLWKELAIPAVKNFIHDMAIGAIERSLYGRDGRYSSGYSRTYRDYGNSLVRTHISTSSSYSQAPQKQLEQKRSGRVITMDDLFFKDRASAQDLIDTLRGEILDHGYVCTADVYDILSTDSDPIEGTFTDNYYGWRDLKDAYVKPSHNGFKVVLPKPIQIN